MLELSGGNFKLTQKTFHATAAAKKNIREYFTDLSVEREREILLSARSHKINESVLSLSLIDIDTLPIEVKLYLQAWQTLSREF